MKKAFSLVELLVVIGIIAVLTGVIMGTFGSSREAALSARCLSNLKNLANAASSYALASGAVSYPPAVSGEYSSPDISKGIASAKLKYFESPGWISWYSKDLYPADSSQASSCRTVGLYSDSIDDVKYAFEHGCLFSYTAGNTSTYLCPEHKNKFPTANWSYFMNPNAAGAGTGRKVTIGERSVSADRILLFAEVPFQGPGSWFPSGSAGTEETDPAIQYEKEHIGCNHKSGKFWVGHVVFCDGHVEKLRASSKSGKVTGENLRELTEWLCEGYDVTFANGAYEKVSGNESKE